MDQTEADNPESPDQSPITLTHGISMNRLFSLVLWALVWNGGGGFSQAFAEAESLWIKPRVYDPPRQEMSQSQLASRLRSASSPIRGKQVQLSPWTKSQATESIDPFSLSPIKIGSLREVSALSTPQKMATALEWTANSDGFLVGHFSIRSPGAAALRLGLRFDLLPPGVEIRFHDESLSQIEAINTKDIQRLLDANKEAGDTSEDASTYWSPVVQGDYLGVEVSLPPETPTSGLEFRVIGVSHLSVNPSQAAPLELAPKAAASCNLDSRCYTDWSSTTNAVARITFVSGGSSFLCTGTLLNDSSSSNTPYFLTANHCISTQTVASTLSSYWFYYSSSCNSGQAFNGIKQVSSGATLLYNSSLTDASFLKLGGSLPSGVVFSGWTTSIPAIGITSTGLHNPTGDLQKISFWLTNEYETCQSSGSGMFTCSPSNQSSANFIDVTQISGTTEGGSSGSGVFLDNNQYLYGQLYGGSASCTNPSGSTVYGLFARTYTNGNLGQWLGAVKQNQTVTVTLPSSLTTLQTANISATASSGLPVTLSSTTPTICSVSNTTVTGKLPGTCTIQGTQAGNDSYNSATGSSSVTVIAAKQNQTVTVTLPSSLTALQTANASATASSGLPVTLNSTTPTICSVSNTTVTGKTSGTCTIQGVQAGNTSYNSATGSSSVTVIKATQTISLSVPSSIPWGSTGTATAKASSGLTVAIASQTPSICSVSNGVISGLYPGSCTINAYQAGNETYNPASSQGSAAIDIPSYPSPLRSLKIRIIGAGLVESSPFGISCNPYCSQLFTKGTMVQLLATPQSGHQFVRWSGGCSGQKSWCSIKMSQARYVTAIFK